MKSRYMSFASIGARASRGKLPPGKRARREQRRWISGVEELRQMDRRHGVLAAVVVLAIPLAVAATAFACGSLATLKLNRATAPVGADVKAVGGNYNSSPRASTVQLRFNGRNGRVLWEGRPSADGRLTGTFAAPDARPGHYVIVATQTGPDGRPAAGTPGRTPLRITRAAASSKSEAAVPAAPFASPPADGPPPPAIAPVTVLAIGLGSLGLLGGGIAVVRTGRRRRLDVARSSS
jgi:hypothetical protein